MLISQSKEFMELFLPLIEDCEPRRDKLEDELGFLRGEAVTVAGFGVFGLLGCSNGGGDCILLLVLQAEVMLI